MELQLKTAAINLPQEIANLEALKAELAPKLKQYNSLVVTEDSIKAAKADKANLNKLRTAIEDQRKAAKKQYLEPYTILEAQCKEVVALIDAPMGAIDKQLKAFDEKEKAEKYSELEAFFSTVQRETFIELQDVLNPKWANKTEKIESLKAEIEAGCQKFHDEYEQINKLYENFPHKLAIIDRFKSTKDFSQTMVYAKNLEFEYEKEQRQKEHANEKSAQNAPEAPSAESNVTTLPEEQSGHSVESEQSQRLIKGRFEVVGTAPQIVALGQYMKANFIRYRIVND